MDTTADRKWHRLAETIRPETRLLIDGKFQAAADGATLSSINPASGAVIADVACGSAADMDAACNVAAKRFRQGVWSRMALRQRIDVLIRFAGLIAENGDLPGGARYAGNGQADCGNVRDRCASQRPDHALHGREHRQDRRRASGPQSGCTSLHPAPAARRRRMHYALELPADDGRLEDRAGPCRRKQRCAEAGRGYIAERAGAGPAFPGGRRPGWGFSTSCRVAAPLPGQALALSMQVDKIAFTGSTGIGRQMYRYAADSNLKAVSAELGGKSPQIVLRDVENLSAVAEKVADGLFGNQGEVCSAGSRILVDRAIHDEFCHLLAGHAARKYRPGDPLDPATTMGPLVNKAHHGRVRGYTDSARVDGATAILGGDSARAQSEQSCFVEPTLFTGVTNHTKIAREEVFGPVGAVIAHDGAEDAIRIANDNHLWPRRRHLDVQSWRGAPHRPRPRMRHGLGQRLYERRHEPALGEAGSSPATGVTNAVRRSSTAPSRNPSG